MWTIGRGGEYEYAAPPRDSPPAMWPCLGLWPQGLGVPASDSWKYSWVWKSQSWRKTQMIIKATRVLRIAYNERGRWAELKTKPSKLPTLKEAVGGKPVIESEKKLIEEKNQGRSLESVHANLHVSIEWINNKVLLCCKGNYIQFLRINHNGKEYEKEYIYIYTHTHMHIYMYMYLYM